MDRYFGFQLKDLGKAWRTRGALPSCLENGWRLLLACGEALPGLHPLKERGQRIPDGACDPNKGWPIPPHAGFGQPAEADLENLGRFLGRKKMDGGRGRRLRPRAAGKRGLRSHFRFPSVDGRQEASRTNVG